MAGLSDDEMVKVTAVAPFEVANAFQAWSNAACDEAAERGLDWPPTMNALALCGGFGPPAACGDETHEQFGLRMAAGLMHFLKES